MVKKCEDRHKQKNEEVHNEVEVVAAIFKKNVYVRDETHNDQVILEWRQGEFECSKWSIDSGGGTLPDKKTIQYEESQESNTLGKDVQRGLSCVSLSSVSF